MVCVSGRLSLWRWAGEADNAAREDVMRVSWKPRQEHGGWIRDIGVREGEGHGRSRGLRGTNYYVQN